MITTLCILQLLAVAAPDADVATSAAPYQVTVCLRLTDNPIVTPLFGHSLRRQLDDQLKSFFGPLADVEVLTEGHWLLDGFEGQSVEHPSLTPEMLKSNAETSKVFLICVDYRDGLYHVAWRNIDGKLGYVGPVHSQSTPDRQWVGKAACLAAKEDFGVVAMLKHRDVGGITFDMQGGEHATRLAKIIGQETIWQPFWVIKHPKGGTVHRPVPYTVVRTLKGKYHEPELVSNLSDPFPRRASIIGLEAVQLNTRSGRIRLRLIDPQTKSPVINCSVSANDEGFEAMDDSDLLERPDRFGQVVSRQEFKNLAYVKVSTGGSTMARFPLPITDSLCDFEIPIAVDSKASLKNDFQRDLRNITQDLHHISAFQSDAVKEFNELNGSKRYEDALKRIATGLNTTGPALANATTMLSRLKQTASSIDNGAVASVANLTTQLEQIQGRNNELGQLKKSIETAIATRNAQDLANVLIKSGQQAEHEADFELAIEKYELALGEQPNQPELQAHLGKLKSLWSKKSAARTFIYDQWATAELTAIETLLPQAEKDFATLTLSGDHLAVQKLLLVNTEHASQITSFIDSLAGSEEAADKKEIEKYSKLAQRIATLQEKVGEYLDKKLADGDATATDVPRPEEETSTAPKSESNESPVSPPLLPDEAEEAPPMGAK